MRRRNQSNTQHCGKRIQVARLTEDGSYELIEGLIRRIEGGALVVMVDGLDHPIRLGSGVGRCIPLGVVGAANTEPRITVHWTSPMPEVQTFAFEAEDYAITGPADLPHLEEDDALEDEDLGAFEEEPFEVQKRGPGRPSTKSSDEHDTCVFETAEELELELHRFRESIRNHRPFSFEQAAY